MVREFFFQGSEMHLFGGSIRWQLGMTQAWTKGNLSIWKELEESLSWLIGSFQLVMHSIAGASQTEGQPRSSWLILENPGSPGVDPVWVQEPQWVPGGGNRGRVVMVRGKSWQRGGRGAPAVVPACSLEKGEKGSQRRAVLNDPDLEMKVPWRGSLRDLRRAPHPSTGMNPETCWMREEATYRDSIYMTCPQQADPYRQKADHGCRVVGRGRGGMTA